MPQFVRQSRQTMTPESYRAVARRLRKIADQIEARCTPQTPHERAALTTVVHQLTHAARALSARHHGRPIYSESDHE